MSAADHGLSVTPQRLTVERYLEGWLDGLTLRPNSARLYCLMVNTYIIPAIGHQALVKLTPADVQRMLARLPDHLGPTTRRHVLSTLRVALNRGVRQQVIPRNVAALVDKPKAGRRVVDAYTEDEARRLLAGVDGHRHELLVTMALTSGLRQGELLALRWQDIDGDVLTVRHTLHQGGVLAEPKTESSNRSVKLSPSAMAALRRHKAAQAAERLAAGRKWYDLDFVFAQRYGQPYAARTVQAAWHRITSESGVPHKPFHSLRHRFATVLLARGVDVTVVSKALGHSSIAITADIYVDWTRPMQEQVAEVIDQALVS